MSKITLITGGAASGKSRWAISYFATCDDVLYIYTGKELGEDTRRRIEFNNTKNDVQWEIISDVHNPCEKIKDHKFFIFDGLASYTARIINEICDDAGNIPYETKKQIEARVIADVIQMMNKVSELNGDMVIVTVETGFSVLPRHADQVAFREIVGAVNQRIANIAQEVYLSASGIQFQIK